MNLHYFVLAMGILFSNIATSVPFSGHSCERTLIGTESGSMNERTDVACPVWGVTANIVVYGQDVDCKVICSCMSDFTLTANSATCESIGKMSTGADYCRVMDMFTVAHKYKTACHSLRAETQYGAATEEEMCARNGTRQPLYDCQSLCENATTIAPPYEVAVECEDDPSMVVDPATIPGMMPADSATDPAMMNTP